MAEKQPVEGVGLPTSMNWIPGAYETPDESILRVGSNMLLALSEDFAACTREGFLKALDEIIPPERRAKTMEGLQLALGPSVSEYEIFLAACYSQMYRRLRLSGNDFKRTHEEIATAFGVNTRELSLILSNRDISKLITIFIEKIAEDMRGVMGFEIFLKALDGDPQFAKMYQAGYNTDRSTGDRIGTQVNVVINPQIQSEDELMANVKKLRKSVGQKQEIIDVDFKTD